jgi:long-subunit acyl-CoA synthetase (AMP-forming)
MSSISLGEVFDGPREVMLRRDASESSQLNELFAALAKAQFDMEIAKTDSANPYFKSSYADLASIVKASRPFLAKNGLAVIQRIVTNDRGALYMHTRLCHASGQWMESRMPINPIKTDIQSLGSHITYLKRYTYAAIVGVVASGDDDDGETAMNRTAVSNNNVTPINSSTINKAQLQIISEELEGHEELLENLLKAYNISKLSDLDAKKYTQCITRIREIKRAKEN